MKKKNISENKLEDLLNDQEGLSDKEIADLKRVYDQLMNEDIPEPPDSLDERFYTLLDNIRAGKKGNLTDRLSGFFRSDYFRTVSRIAAGIALFIIGWTGSSILDTNKIDSREIAALSTEMAGLKQTLILTMLSGESPSERIQAVNMVTEMNEVDNRIISGMLSTLNNDPNVNVRLLALETLTNYIEYPEVREGLIRSITKQDSPMIQYRLAEIMEIIEEDKSIPEFQKMLTDLSLDYNVRERIDKTIKVLL